MKKVFKNLILFVIVAVTAIPCALVSAYSATDKAAKIHSLVPKAKQYYPGVEDYIADALRDMKSSVDVSEFGISTNNIPAVYKSAVFTNPDIFYVDAASIHYNFDTSNGQVGKIYPTYTLSKSNIPSYKKKFNKAVNKILKGIDSSLSSFQKALAVHDKIVTNCMYKSNSGDIAYTAYGALVKKKAVCEGYSRAYCYLLSKLGVESKVINNQSKEHCWNYVKVGGKWYHVDVTSDDPTPDTCGYVSHTYFAVSDGKLKSLGYDLHQGYKDDITYSSTYKCSSKKYNGSVFRKSNTEVICKKNIFYYINNNFKNKHYSALIKRKNGKNKTVKIVKDKWMTKSGKLYNNSYSRLCYLDGYIYMTTSREIYRYKLKSGKLKRVFVMPSFWKKSFHGIKANGRIIIVNKKYSLLEKSVNSKALKIRSNQSVFQYPFIRSDSVRLKVKTSCEFKVYRGTGKVRYKSSNKKIAKVNSKGVVKALKKGTATVTAVKNDIKFKLKVKVYK